MLHAPDFLGYQDAIQMAKDYPKEVQRALELKKIGNELVTLLGGREIHPINLKVGGFYKVPTKRQLASIVEHLKWARDAAVESTRLVGTFRFPKFEQDYEFVALRHPDEYPFNEGHVASNKGLDIPVRDFENHFFEEHMPYSSALHSLHKERGSYFVGPLARYNVNFDRLSPLAQEAARSAGLSSECRNPFKSIIVRCVEMVYACDEALRIIDEYEMPEEPAVEVKPHASMGYGCTEAPRGSLYHRYRIDDSGAILDARIVPPTAQNQRTIENDLREYVSKNLRLTQEKLTWQCEQVVRNYDPCISCSAHSLKLTIERE
jgi:coenzyme F420-reducing hydrogenase alpha subunit